MEKASVRAPAASRRGFLKAAAAIAAPFVIPASAIGADGRPAPSERITMGFIGVGGQGGGHLYSGAWTYLPGGYLGRDDVQVLGVCDIQKSRRDYAMQRVHDHYSKQAPSGQYRACQAYVDFRELLARPDIDAVLIATPIHWHAMMTVMAAKAGKDVYCEKPIALTVREGRAMYEAIRRYGRVFQAGTQQRSEYGGKFRLACELVRSGRIGQLKTVYAYEHGGGFVWRKWFAGRAAPPEIDWELFLGPAPWSPFNGSLDAHMFGFGGINWGQHHFDIVEWGVGADADPVQLGIEDGKLTMRYSNGVVVYGAPYPDPTIGLGPNVKFVGEGGVVFVGTEGRIAVDRQQILSNPPEILKRKPGPGDTHLYYSQSHSGNFLECVRTRKKPITDIDSSYRAVKLLLLGGIAETVRRPLKWDERREMFANDDEANRLLSMACRAPWRM